MNVNKKIDDSGCPLFSELEIVIDLVSKLFLDTIGILFDLLSSIDFEGFIEAILSLF